jgi:hypothetical protein
VAERPRSRRPRATRARPRELRRTREIVLAETTCEEAERRLLEQARPLIELAVTLDQEIEAAEVYDAPDPTAAVRAAVQLVGPCPKGWCRYPDRHDGECQPLLEVS